MTAEVEWGGEFLRVGDVVSFGAGPSIPPDLVGKYFKVEAVSGEGTVAASLSLPYLDPDCTVRYHPKPPGVRVHPDAVRLASEDLDRA